MIALTAVMSFFENVSTTYIIAELSPIRFPPPPPPPPHYPPYPRGCEAISCRGSYNVLGHCKTCVIIVGGAMLFRKVQPPNHSVPLSPPSIPLPPPPNPRAGAMRHVLLRYRGTLA
jgi:hypothetical protein